VLPRIFCLVDATDDLSLLPTLADVGVTGFQVRAKALAGRELMVLTDRVLTGLASYDVTVVVNDRLDVALAAGAHGVHLGRGDLGVAAARRIAPDLVIGGTCRNRADVERAAADGADYVGFGPVFATTSKTGLPAPLGPDAITAAAGVLPLIAIGGIDAANAPEVISAGAHGVAVIGAVWRDPDPVWAAKDLVTAVG